MTGNSHSHKITAGVAMLMAVVMLLSVSVAPAAAASGVSPPDGSPDNIPIGVSSVDGVVISPSDATDGGTDSNSITITGVDGDNDIAVAIPLDNLQSAGVDFSQATVAEATVNDDQGGTGFEADGAGIARVSNARDQIEILIDGGTLAGGTNSLDLEIELDGVNTEEASIQSGLSYSIQVQEDEAAPNDFGGFGTFPDDTDVDTVTNEFDLVAIENVDTGNNFGSISNALGAASNGETIEVGSGTYVESDIVGTLSATDVTLTSTAGADETTIQSTAGAGSPIVDLASNGNDVSGFTIDGFTLDANGAGVLAIDRSTADVDDEDFTLTDSAVTTSGDQGTGLIQVADRAGSVEITNSSIDAGSLTGQNAVVVADEDSGLELNFSMNDVTGFDSTGLVLNPSASDLSTLSLENNSFEDNAVHIDDSSGSDDYDLAAFTADNEFDKYVQTLDNSDTPISAIQGNDLSGVINGLAAEETALLSGGDFDLTGGTATVGSNDATVTSVAGASETTVAATGGNPVVSVDAQRVEISGITFDADGNQNPVIQTAASNINDLTIENNRFTGYTGSSTYVDLATNTQDYNGFTAQNNTFVGNENDVIAINVDPDSTDNQVITITENTITGAYGASDKVVVTPNDDADGFDLTISDNVLDNVDQSANGVIQVDTVTEGGTTAASTVEITGNEITGRLAGDSGTTAINIVDVESADSVSIANNQIADFAAVGSTAIDVSNYGTTNGLEVADNTLDTNGVHISFDSASDLSRDSLISGNTYETRVEAEDENGDLITDAIHGTIEAGLDAQDNSAVTETILVAPGTYTEATATPTEDDVVIESTGETGETILTVKGEDNDIFDLSGANNNVVIDGFTFASEGAGNDVDINNAGTNDPVVRNSLFRGPGTSERTAIRVNNVGGTEAVIQNVDIQDYATGVSAPANTPQVNVTGSTISSVNIGVDIQSASGDTIVDQTTISSASSGIVLADGDARVTQSTIQSSDIGVQVSAAAEVIRSDITNNGVGVVSDDAGATVTFNDIVNNDIGLDADDEGSALPDARANWWGAETGPSGTEVTGDGDEVVIRSITEARAENLLPWLTASVDTLPEDEYVVVTDPRPPIAQGTDAATDADGSGQPDDFETDFAGATSVDHEVLVVSLGTGVAGADTSIVTDLTINDNTANNVAPASPLSIDVGASDPGDYSIEVVNTADELNSGSATQTLTGDVAGVEVTTDSDTLVADGESTANITVQLVDSNGNLVPRTGTSVSYSVGNSGDAGVTRESQDDQTSGGEATLEISATEPGVDVTVTGVDDDNNNAGNVVISTLAPTTANLTVELAEGPTTITQNESYSATLNVTNEGDGAGTQTIEYVLEDNDGLSSGIEASEEVSLDAGNSTEVTFEVPANATADLETGNYTHVFASDDDELTVDVEVVEEGADETALARFDSGDDGTIDRDEAVSAIVAYNTGGTVGGEPVTRDQAVNVIVAYNTGVSV